MREIDLRLRRAARLLRLKPGDLFEDCAYHPVLCLGVDYKTDEVWGVSLIDGSYPRACSMLHCGVRRLTAKEAWQIKMKGPPDSEARQRIKPDHRWWTRTDASEYAARPVRLVGPRTLRQSKARRKTAATR
jgi:hypothetical protein